MPDGPPKGKFFENLRTCLGNRWEEVATQFTPGQRPDFAKIMNDPNKACIPECVLKKFNAIDAQGQLIVDKVKEMNMPGKPDDSKITACVDKNKDEKDKCARLIATSVCLLKRGKA